jgi:hypothetical protein
VRRLWEVGTHVVESFNDIPDVTERVLERDYSGQFLCD